MRTATERSVVICCWTVSLLLAGCGSEPYTPVEPAPEQEELAAELAPLREEFRAAFAASGDYVLVAILDRQYSTRSKKQEPTKPSTRGC